VTLIDFGELQPKRTLAASRGFLAVARLSCFVYDRVNMAVKANFKMAAAAILDVAESEFLQQNVMQIFKPIFKMAVAAILDFLSSEI